MDRWHSILALVPILLVGCDPLTFTDPITVATAPNIESRFDPTQSGTLSGRIGWKGELPRVPPVDIPGYTLTRVPAGPTPNPNAPKIDSISGGLPSAIVFLRGMDPERARAWDLPAVGVELTEKTIEVRQGDQPPGRVGFVRAGAAVRFESRAASIAGVRGRGAEFFSYVFPPQAVPVVRNLNHEGRVELHTASGQFWAAADLFVMSHPYITKLNAHGQFTLVDVPSGDYELVVWHANWNAAPHVRDPETGALARRGYLPPVEKVVPVRVRAGMSSSIDVTLSLADVIQH